MKHRGMLRDGLCVFGGQMVPYKSFIASLMEGGGWLALLGPKLTPVFCVCGVLMCFTMLCTGLLVN